MGKRTSVYLPDDLAEAVSKSGTGLAALIRRGLEATVPTAVYRLHDGDGRLLYVGVSSTPERRFAEHAKVQPWWSQVERREVAWFDDRLAALKAEAQAMTTEDPVHNVLQSWSPDGKWESFNVRMRAADLARLDEMRGDLNRSEFMRGLALTAMGEWGETPADRDARIGVSPATEPERLRRKAAAAPEPGSCSHPKGRRQKNGTYCGACGTGGLKP